MENKDFYNFVKEKSQEKPIGIAKWKTKLKLNISSQATKMFNFIFSYLKDNKLKIFRWKLLHYILPCKMLLHQWKITQDDKCNMCKEKEDYEHLFLNCQYVKEFWGHIKLLFQKAKIGTHIICFKNLIMGYKIYDETYYEINYFITILLFTIYKSIFLSHFKQKKINVYSLFKNELLQQLDVCNASSNNKNSFTLLSKIASIM